MPVIAPAVRAALARGTVIPACPLALNADRRLDERRQRALLRYYIDAGAGGLAVGVHTTQFAIRKVGLFEPLLALTQRELDLRAAAGFARVGGICGDTRQALGEAEILRRFGFHCGLLSLGALRDANESDLIRHAKAVSEVIPIFGFYLQPAAGGRLLPYEFWRRLAELENVIGIKIAPFNRYQTIDVLRAVFESGRDDIALYTGNDDNIVLDLITNFRFRRGEEWVEGRIVGGLLGHWAVWTHKAVDLLQRCQNVDPQSVSGELLTDAIHVTDANAAFFDAANHFSGCIAGIHEVLRRQGLLEGTWCLDPNERLSPGQAAEIDRVYKAYPELNDDAFVASNLERWLQD